jgi:hypothetical protein
MPEEVKKSGMLAQITIAIVIALCVGGSSPWWFKEMFSSLKPEATAVETSRPVVAKGNSTDKLATVDRADLADRQEQLENELAELRQEQKQNPQPRSVRNQTASVSGAWQGGGSSYTFYQNGTDITMSETTEGYGQTAVGEGTLVGRDLVLTIRTALGSQGTLRAVLSEDGKTLSGTYSDQTFGSETPYTITR